MDSRVTRVPNDRVQTQPGEIRQEILQDHQLAALVHSSKLKLQLDL
jgi:hypothetical protein